MRPLRFAALLQYRWPKFTTVRTFHEVAVLDGSTSDVIAEYSGLPAAIKRAYGKGRLIFPGSMLGPGIRAGEAEAQQLAASLSRASDLQEDFVSEASANK